MGIKNIELLKSEDFVIDASMSSGNVKHIAEKLNELIEAYNQHVHYAREMQFPTSTPDNPNVYS